MRSKNSPATTSTTSAIELLDRHHKYRLREFVLTARYRVYRACRVALHACQQSDDGELQALAWALRIAADFLEGPAIGVPEEDVIGSGDVPLEEALVRVHQEVEQLLAEHGAEGCACPGQCRHDCDTYRDSQAIATLCVAMLGRWQQRAGADPAEADPAVVITRK